MTGSPGVIWILAWIILCVNSITGAKNSFNPAEVIYAINAGGDSHVDSWGVKYDRDPLLGKTGSGVGTASDYGKQLGSILRVTPQDRVLYQTERYHHSTFGYDIPAKEDGDFVLVLKFCEVYFGAPDMKVFDVVLNGDHTVVTDLDIFQSVGRGVAHDEYIPYSVRGGKLYYEEEESDIRGNMIRVEFIKGYRDNPKINAMYVMRGTPDLVPRLPFLPREVEPEELVEEDEKIRKVLNRKPSGPKHPDPYDVDDTSIMLPVFVAIGAFVPLLFCLCKL